jgi:uncharacterized phage protein (TIGR02218 family)
MLGDSRCTVDLSSFQVTGTVTSLGTNKRRMFTDTSRTEIDDIFAGGVIEWVGSGDSNFGFSEQIDSYNTTTKTFTLVRSIPNDIVVSDSYRATRACDKTIDTCSNIFNNAINSRSEPWIPISGSVQFNYGPPAVRKTRRGTPWDR